jgi:hypothetical protein
MEDQMRCHRLRVCAGAALLFAAAGFSRAHAAGLTLTTNVAAYVAGDGIRVNAHADALPQSFDAWAVILAPDGTRYSMSLAGTLSPGAVPIARSAPGLAADTDALLLNMVIPGGAPRGEYEAVLVFLPAGTAPTSVEDAEAKAIPGYFTRALFHLVSGRVGIDIDGTWNVTLEGLGSGTMTLARYEDNFIVEGEFAGEGELGNASVLGFIDLEVFTLFLDFADSPGTTDMTLSGGESGAALSGTWSSDVFDPPAGAWTGQKP